MNNRQLIESLEKYTKKIQEVSVNKWQRGAKNSLPGREFVNLKNTELTLDPDYYSDEQKQKILNKRFKDAQRYTYANKIAGLDLKDFDTNKIPARTMQKALRSYK